MSDPTTTPCRWCDQPLYLKTWNSPVTGTTYTRWFHAESRSIYCRDYGDGWVSVEWAQPREPHDQTDHTDTRGSK